MRRPGTGDAAGVLITRPEPGAADTAARVAALGFRPVLAPALSLAPRPAALPAAQAVVVTSPAAARALPVRLHGLPLFATGPASAEAARAAGFRHVEGAEGEAASLAGLVAARCAPKAGPLLLAIGEGYGRELAAALRARGFRVHRRVVYAAREAESLPEEAACALRSGLVRAALFFSPRSARAAMALIEAAGLRGAARGIAALALSPRIATILRAWPWARVAAADAPHQDRLLALLGAGPDEEQSA
ncbi:MAG: uroporphyrinogen-III synthase [Acetobacteraceae bacterium]|nr:uroporphyrinogen-III synthase [Acetobacteraceae bacterium]